MGEPFGAVDPITRDALQSEIARVHAATKKTIVFVTHDIEEALRLANVIAILERGRLAQWGAPLDIVEHPASGFVRDFVGGEGSGLKSLGLRKIAERGRTGEAAPGQPLPAEASLREALAAMTERYTD